MKKTWIVGPYHEYWCQIVHADTRGQARKMLVEFELGIEFTDVQALRQPELDGKLITLENLIQAGFPEEWDGEPIQARYYVGACSCELCKGSDIP